ncbi:MAG: RNA polymerase factor sigma-32 [Alphaproteobacteria bacterium]|nr:RNA polymerase factor sigma-32 [Alphaproteobacteria bacterium]
MFDTASEQAYVRAAMRVPMLDRERERELAARWHVGRDERALRELIAPHLRLVIAMAGRFRGYGLSLDDLIQEGTLGLFQAAQRFEPGRDIRFSTYARWYVRSSIQDFVLRNWSIVRSGTTSAQKTMFFNLRRLRARLQSGSGASNESALRDMARTFRLALCDVQTMAQRLDGGDVSLNSPLPGGDAEQIDLLPDPSPSPEARVAAAEEMATRRAWLGRALKRLSLREQMIVRTRHLQDRVTTLSALGARLGISKERVRQIEGEALTKLRALS